MKHLILIAVFLPLCGFSQTKKELIEQVAKQKVSIDSLNKVVANFENIVENRDRSIRIIKEDKTELTKDKAALKQIVHKHEQTIFKLEQNAEIGTAKVVTLDNKMPPFKPKKGKYWVINQIISDYSAGTTTDSLGNIVMEEIHVFFKSLNGETLTDISQNKYGPQIYSSLHPEHSMHHPIIIDQNSNFALIIMKGPLSNMTPYSGKVFFSYTEKVIN